MELRFFGSQGCNKCWESYIILTKYNIDYEYIDANEDNEDVQGFCDKHNVFELPHFQFIHNGKIIKEHIGLFTQKEVELFFSLKRKIDEPEVK